MHKGKFLLRFTAEACLARILKISQTCFLSSVSIIVPNWSIDSHILHVGEHWWASTLSKTCLMWEDLILGSLVSTRVHAVLDARVELCLMSLSFLDGLKSNIFAWSVTWFVSLSGIGRKFKIWASKLSWGSSTSIKFVVNAALTAMILALDPRVGNVVLAQRWLLYHWRFLDTLKVMFLGGFWALDLELGQRRRWLVPVAHRMQTWWGVHPWEVVLRLEQIDIVALELSNVVLLNDPIFVSGQV